MKKVKLASTASKSITVLVNAEPVLTTVNIVIRNQSETAFLLGRLHHRHLDGFLPILQVVRWIIFFMIMDWKISSTEPLLDEVGRPNAVSSVST